MCFSPEADFVGGVLVGGVGIATLAQARHKREIPLAVLPLAFAGHEIAEGFVWLGQRGTIAKSVGDVAVYAYLFFAWALLPVLIPIAVRLVETDRHRRRLMGILVVLGSAVGAYLLWVVADHSVTAHVAGNSIDYRGVGDIGNTVTVLYVVATCGTFVLSSSRRIVWFGVANLAAVGVIAEVKSEGLTSLWCFWAAIVSVLIYLHFRDLRRVADRPEQPPTASPEPTSRERDGDPEVVRQ
jgi:hypothetical protein